MFTEEPTMTAKQPATPLPWTYQEEARVQFGILGSARLPAPHSTSKNNQADAAYIAHACNAYPRLVDFVRQVASENRGPRGAAADALLHELGENA